MTQRQLIVLFVTCVGCGGGGGGGGDDTTQMDAPVVVPTTITVTGTATARGATSTTMLMGVTVGAYQNADETTAVATTTTDASGNYTLTITTNGAALNGFIKATIAGYMDTYLYPPSVVTMDFSGASINMITSGTFGLLANTLCAANSTNADGAIAVIVWDSAMMPVTGASVSSTPAAGKYCYNMGAFPNKNATMTDTDGVAYMLKFPPGMASVTAAKTGSTFASHDVKVRANTFTTTLIQP